MGKGDFTAFIDGVPLSEVKAGIKHKHKWVKKKYKGKSVVASWEFCPFCHAERKRKVQKIRGMM